MGKNNEGLFNEALPEFGTIEKILPNLAFNASNLIELGDSPLLNVVFPNIMGPAAWWGGAWNNSLGKLGVFAPFLKVKSPIQNNTIAPPIGLPGISGKGKGR